jgi:D-serine dehydratase
MNDERIDALAASPLDKGLPPSLGTVALNDLAAAGLNLLRDDLPTPVAVLKQSALDHNSKWMQAFLEASGASIAPHGKTTMSPQLFRRQLRDGAWGITLSNVHQIKAGRYFGLRRIVMANELVGRSAIEYVLDEIENDPEFDFYCLVDNIDNVEQIVRIARARGGARPLQVFVEAGVAARRAGCRTLDEAMAVARAVAGNAPFLALRGVEGFEGTISGPDPRKNAAAVETFMEFIGDIARRCADEGCFADGEVLLSAGGSSYFDIVTAHLGKLDLGRPTRVLLRSGCYLTHDSAMYAQMARQLLERTPELHRLGEPLRPALEVWAHVLSRPEPDRIIVGLGKRDASYDAGLPMPLGWSHPGANARYSAIPPGHVAFEINDQHLFVRTPADTPLKVGDMVGFGISHPCLTLDKWRVIPVVDDDYTIVSAVSTAF